MNPSINITSNETWEYQHKLEITTETIAENTQPADYPIHFRPNPLCPAATSKTNSLKSPLMALKGNSHTAWQKYISIYIPGAVKALPIYYRSSCDLFSCMISHAGGVGEGRDGDIWATVSRLGEGDMVAVECSMSNEQPPSRELSLPSSITSIGLPI